MLFFCVLFGSSFFIFKWCACASLTLSLRGRERWLCGCCFCLLRTPESLYIQRERTERTPHSTHNNNMFRRVHAAALSYYTSLSLVIIIIIINIAHLQKTYTSPCLRFTIIRMCFESETFPLCCNATRILCAHLKCVYKRERLSWRRVATEKGTSQAHTREHVRRTEWETPNGSTRHSMNLDAFVTFFFTGYVLVVN